MKIKKSTIQGIVQYICDINEFGFEDDNIDSMAIWADKAESILYKLKESDESGLIGVNSLEESINRAFKNHTNVFTTDDKIIEIKEDILKEINKEQHEH